MEDNMDPTHIVAVTSYQVETFRKDCIKAGMKSMYEKPLAMNRLHMIMWQHFYRLDNEECKSLYQIQFNN